MATHLRARSLAAATVATAAACLTLAIASHAESPLALDSARITISGTSNVHAYAASTTSVRLAQAQLGAPQPGAGVWERALQPGGLEGLAIVVPAATLTSSKDGLDKNMHKALKVQQHPDITFRLIRLEPDARTPGAARATGVMRIAGIEREVVLDLETEPAASALSVKGRVELLMTDFGIKPPKAMLGMLKTDPKVTITFEALFRVPLT